MPDPKGRPGMAKTETINCVNRYRFAWHIVYHYAEDAQPLLPAGTVLHVTSWHDNSPANKFNPDPSNWVGFGQRSVDDMAFAWMTYYELTDEQYKEALAERQNKLKATTQNQQQQQQQSRPGDDVERRAANAARRLFHAARPIGAL